MHPKCLLFPEAYSPILLITVYNKTKETVKIICSYTSTAKKLKY